jgi:hypothetical protein
MARGNGCRTVYARDADRQLWLATLAEMVEGFGVVLHCYCPMGSPCNRDALGESQLRRWSGFRRHSRFVSTASGAVAGIFFRVDSRRRGTGGVEMEQPVCVFPSAPRVSSAPVCVFLNFPLVFPSGDGSESDVVADGAQFSVHQHCRIEIRGSTPHLQLLPIV